MSSFKFTSVILIFFLVIFAVALIGVAVTPLIEYWNFNHASEALGRPNTIDNSHFRNTREESLVGIHQGDTARNLTFRDFLIYRTYSTRVGSVASQDNSHNASTASLSTIAAPPPVYIKPLSIESQGLPSYEMSFSKEHIPPAYTRQVPWSVLISPG